MTCQAISQISAGFIGLLSFLPLSVIVTDTKPREISVYLFLGYIIQLPMRFFLFVSLFLLSFQCQATHILGGLVSYDVVDINSADFRTDLEVSFTMYRDVNGGGADFDRIIEIGVYKKISTEDYVFVSSVETGDPVIIAAETNPLNPQVLIEYGTYNARISLDHGSDYLIAYQRCCRSELITNLDEAGDLGFSLQLELTELALEKDLPSPSLTALPFTIAPLNSEFEFPLPLKVAPSITTDLSLSDFYIAGGSVQGATECCDCIMPNPRNCIPSYEPAPFTIPYSSDSPFGPDNNISFSSSGIFSGKMNITGSYQYGIEILSSLNGELLSRQILDYNLISALVSSTDELSESIINVYPNPTKDHLIVVSDSKYRLSYELIDIRGEIVQTGKLEATSKIDLETEGGLYYLKVVDLDSGYTYSKSFVQLP